MPYSWSTLPEKVSFHKKSDGPAPVVLTIRTHNSLNANGFMQFIALTAALMLIPVLAFLGQIFMWIIAGSLGTCLTAIWLALKASWKQGQLREELSIWSDYVLLERFNPNGSTQVWHANPYWTEIRLTPTNSYVLNYLTLRGNSREVEIGAFLSEDERPLLEKDLLKAFNAATTPH
ncbi:MAG: DUF2244 domain-containing protein [Planktomarina sp.]|nr:DUF2244 domain-containing protein [Planktomarina sp.]